MSVLSDLDILRAQARGSLGVTPWDPAMVQPASIDLRLDRHFRVMTTAYNVIDPAQEQPDLTRPVTIGQSDEDPFYLPAGGFALACTLETISVPTDLVGRLEGKSSLGRLGLLTHITAGYIDPGFHGQITLELTNVAPLPIALYPGMKIAQLSLTPTTTVVGKPYGSVKAGSHYQGQIGPTPSRSWVNFHVEIGGRR